MRTCNAIAFMDSSHVPLMDKSHIDMREELWRSITPCEASCDQANRVTEWEQILWPGWRMCAREPAQ
eukprot:6409791-Amphidinium_carterae.1